MRARFTVLPRGGSPALQSAKISVCSILRTESKASEGGVRIDPGQWRNIECRFQADRSEEVLMVKVFHFAMQKSAGRLTGPRELLILMSTGTAPNVHIDQLNKLQFQPRFRRQ